MSKFVFQDAHDDSQQRAQFLLHKDSELHAEFGKSHDRARLDITVNEILDPAADRLVITESASFRAAIERMLLAFKHCVEQRQGWRLLWNEDKSPRDERAAQHLLLALIEPYAKQNGFDVTREANTGRGAVDLKLSLGQTWRALIELKCASHPRLLSGLQTQLPLYMHSEQVELGFFVVVAFTDAEWRLLESLPEVVESSAGTIRSATIDARRDKPTASRA